MFSKVAGLSPTWNGLPIVCIDLGSNGPRSTIEGCDPSRSDWYAIECKDTWRIDAHKAVPFTGHSGRSIWYPNASKSSALIWSRCYDILHTPCYSIAFVGTTRSNSKRRLAALFCSRHAGNWSIVPSVYYLRCLPISPMAIQQRHFGCFLRRRLDMLVTNHTSYHYDMISNLYTFLFEPSTPEAE